jgi:hypothetical protein
MIHYDDIILLCFKQFEIDNNNKRNNKHDISLEKCVMYAIQVSIFTKIDFKKHKKRLRK